MKKKARTTKEPIDQPARAEAPAISSGVMSLIKIAIASARRVVGDFVGLVALETRRAGQTLMWLVALGIVVGLSIVGAWGALMALFAIWIVSLGATWLVAIGSIAALNLLVAVIAVIVATKISRNLTFPATRRQLSGSPPFARGEE